MNKKLLLRVRKPARYINNEINSIKKDLSKVDLKFALAFPDTYEVGMSNLGISILYGLLNERDNIACERVFAPWIDYEEVLRRNDEPLTSLENSLPLKRFDVVGFSLQYELCNTNVLNMLDLAGIELYSKQRGEDDPIILGGGPTCYNPEPMADFFDAFLIGDGEEAIGEICDIIIRLKKNGCKKKDILDKLSAIQGIYVPSLFEVDYKKDGKIKKVTPLKKGYSKVKKIVVKDINNVYYPKKQIVPFVKPIHDRYNMEIARGCIRGCRFCQAGYVYRPYRERSCESILKNVDEGLKNTGYEELSLLSLSTGDFSFISPLLSALMDKYCDEKIAVSLPSLRPGTTDESLMVNIKRVRKTGFTLAPEAASEKLRRVINKNITQEELLKTADNLFKLGWRNIKLYFMIGLPFETMDDVKEIVNLSTKVRDTARKYNIFPKINVSVSNFTPKGHTPFQFAKQEDEESLKEKHFYLKRELQKKRLNFKWHDTKVSILEGVFSRGDRRLAAVIKKAWEMGAKFDEWTEIFDYSIWQRAFHECGTDIDFYLRERSFDEILPYEHIDTGVDKGFLIEEYKLAEKGVYSPPCKEGCQKCGVCGEDLKLVTNNIFASERFAGERFAGGIKPRVKPRPIIVKKKLRFKYTKLEESSFIGHLDMQNIFIRALSRAGIKYDYSKGFHPMPKLSFGAAIPIGLNSISEFAEIDLLDNIAPKQFMEKMNDNLPGGLKIISANEASFKAKSLFSSITAVKYEADLNLIEELKDNVERIKKSLDEFNTKEEVILNKVKKGRIRAVNAKEFVDKIGFEPDSGKLTALIRRTEKGELNIFDLLEILFKLKKDDIICSEILKTESIIGE
jgi:radical SAM family uncharacterized protein/radical SAM-linked protein